MTPAGKPGPRTEAGKALSEAIASIDERLPIDPGDAIRAIEEQATAEADLRLLVMTTARDAAVVEADRLRAEARREERAHGVTIDQRDAAEDAADRLAYAIAPVEVIGEHSNGNDPWQNAIEHLEGERQAVTEACRELLAKVEGLHAEPGRGVQAGTWTVNRADMRRLIEESHD